MLHSTTLCIPNTSILPTSNRSIYLNVSFTDMFQGGYPFYIKLDTSSDSFTGQFQVMFGDIPPVPAVRINDSLLNGKVPGKSVYEQRQNNNLNLINPLYVCRRKT